MLKCKICLEYCKVCFTFVASNFTIMRDYRKHLTLLPHRWQTGALFAAGVLAVIYYCLFAYTIRSLEHPSDTYRLYWLGILHLPVSVALMIACLSKEKEEDEYISSVRYRALAIAMFLYFVLRASGEMMYGSLHSFVFNRNLAGMNVIADIMGSSAFRITRQIIGFIGSVNFTMVIYIILVKVLKRLGIENGNKSILLPNNYKKVGWYLLIVSMVMIVAIVILDAIFGHLHEMYEKHSTLLRLMILIPYIALIFICLSKEKQEDEFIRLIRVRILIYFAIFYLVVGMISGLSENLWQLYQFRTMNNRAYVAQLFVLIMRLLSWFPLLAVVYSQVLKKVLAKNLIESGNEE